jgi:hypothetical protein
MKQLARLDRVDHRIIGDYRFGCSAHAGFENAYCDHRRCLAPGLPAEPLHDDNQATTVGFLMRTGPRFGLQGIECRRVLFDNGSAYRFKFWLQACEALRVTYKHINPTSHVPTARLNWMTAGRLRLHQDLAERMV